MTDEHLNGLRQDVPPMPDAYMRRIDNTLKEIENMHVDKRMKVPVALIALLIVALVFSGIALAASNSNLINRLFHYQTEPSDLDLPIERDLAVTELDGLKLSISEALYDGSAARVNWTMDSAAETPVYVGYAIELRAGEADLTVEDRTPSVEEHVLRMLNGAPAEGYFDIFLEEQHAGRPIDVAITAHVYTSQLIPTPVEEENFAENNAFYYSEEEAARRDAANIIVVDEDGYANITRYPSYQRSFDALDMNTHESYAQLVLRASEDSGLMKRIATLDVKATLNAAEKPLKGSLMLAAPQVIARGDEILTVTRADFSPASTRIEFTAQVPQAVYDPETNDWHGAFEYPLMLTNIGHDPLMMDLGIGWDGYEQEDGSYLIKGFMYGRPMSDLKQDFYLVVSDPETPINLAMQINPGIRVADIYRAYVTTDDPARVLKLDLIQAE